MNIKIIQFFYKKTKKQKKKQKKQKNKLINCYIYKIYIYHNIYKDIFPPYLHNVCLPSKAGLS